MNSENQVRALSSLAAIPTGWCLLCIGVLALPSSALAADFY
jgi:hypothetical protein